MTLRRLNGRSMQALDRYFEDVYKSRWSSLREALAGPTQQVTWESPFEGVTDGHYAVDGASPVAALAVQAKPGDRVLDLCAAPGGKALVLAAQLRTSGLLVANDKAAVRRTRLRRVFETFLPVPALEARDLKDDLGELRIAIAGIDATDRRALAALPKFSRVLVDAPCSNERRFAQGRAAGETWSPARVKRDAKIQLAILRGALSVLEPDGRLVYSTCSIAPRENDDVVRKFVRTSHRPLRVTDPLDGLSANATRGAERTAFGAVILPDVPPYYGPLYWAVLIAE